MKRTRGGFTLVELLVVIAIIGILVGLLLPALGAVRERMRSADCSNRVRQLALAAIQHETQKGHLPGYVRSYGVFAGGADPTDPQNFSNNVPRHVKVGGFGVALLPFVDAQGTFEHWSQDRYPILSDGSGDLRATARLSGNGFHPLAAANLAIFRCPSNPAEYGSNGNNSYVSNNGMSHLRGGSQIINFGAAESRQNGVFNTKYVGLIPNPDPSPDCGRTVGPDLTLDDIMDGKSSTMTFGENVQAAPWHRPGFLNGADLVVAAGVEDIVTSHALMLSKFSNGMVWHFEDADTGQSHISVLPADPNCNIPTIQAGALDPEHKINGAARFGPSGIFTREISPASAPDLARPSSAHVAGFNAGFADGATRFISDTIDYRAYQAMLTPRGKNSSVPFAEFVLTDEIEQ